MAVGALELTAFTITRPAGVETENADYHNSDYPLK
jgi:hypothetical protein